MRRFSDRRLVGPWSTRGAQKQNFAGKALGSNSAAARSEDGACDGQTHFGYRFVPKFGPAKCSAIYLALKPIANS
jgi:hypothetical protein